MRNLLFITFILTLTASVAVAQIEFTQEFSGSIASTQTDIDGDGGDTALVGAFAGSSTLGGDFTVQSLTELATVPVMPPVNCVMSEVEFPFVSFSTVQRFSGPGILLYYVLDPFAGGYNCADPATGAFRGVVNFLIIGGTGPATDATGTAVFEFTGQTISIDSLGGPVHSAISGTSSGTLIPAG